MIITIDGPTASGKSTAARMIAQELGWYYLASGYLYRALAYLLVQHFGYNQETIGAPTLQDVSTCFDPNKFVYEYKGDGPLISYEGIDVTQHLKNKEIDKLTSILATNALVREKLMEFQRHLASNRNIVVEGRDIGSIVFPQAEIKFFITAALEERARRWQQYMAQQGMNYTIDEAAHAITDRDDRDSRRTHSPLVAPHGATVIDNTSLTKEETLQQMLDVIQAKTV